MSIPTRVGAAPAIAEHGHTKRGDGGELSPVLIRKLARRPILTTAVAYTVTEYDDVIEANATGGGFTVTLPKVGNYPGIVFTITKTDSSANVVTVDGNGADTINGSASAALVVQYQTITVYAGASGWVVL